MREDEIGQNEHCPSRHDVEHFAWTRRRDVCIEIGIILGFYCHFIFLFKDKYFEPMVAIIACEI